MALGVLYTLPHHTYDTISKHTSEYVYWRTGHTSILACTSCSFAFFRSPWSFDIACSINATRAWAACRFRISSSNSSCVYQSVLGRRERSSAEICRCGLKITTGKLASVESQRRHLYRVFFGVFQMQTTPLASSVGGLFWGRTCREPTHPCSCILAPLCSCHRYTLCLFGDIVLPLWRL